MSVLILVLWTSSGLGILYLALAGLMVGRLARRTLSEAAEAPSVTMLKPLHGAEPGLLENLLSFVRQDYPGPVQIVLGVQRSDDPAVAVARELQRACPGRDIVLAIDARLHGSNRKVSNLINMAEAARNDVVVLADSDMRVVPDYLSRLVAELGRPGVGAVTCPYHGVPRENGWSRLAALALGSHFLPGVAMGVGLGLGHPCMGSTIALRRDTLERIGGFRILADELADDHELGARVRSLGFQVAVTPFTVGHVCAERSFAELVAQELRWQRTIRQVAPAGHLGSVVAHPLAFALLALLIQPGPLPAALVAAAIAARIGVCLAVERAFGVKAHPYGLVPARDLLSFALFVASFLGRGVSWRGYRYEAAPGGALLPKARPDPL